MNIFKKLISITFLTFFLSLPSYAADKDTKEKTAAQQKNETSRTLSKNNETAKSNTFSGEGHQLSRSNIHNRKRSEDTRMRRSHLRKRSPVENANRDKVKNEKKTKTPETHSPKR